MTSPTRHTALLLLVLAAMPLPVLSQVPAAADTTRLYRYDEVVVTTDRYPETAEKAGAVPVRIDADPSWEFGGAGRALSAVRNIHVASYGGGMSLRTLSIRGMAAEHTLLLWNGMPAGNMQTGISDLSLLDETDLRAIHVVPGGAEAIHGNAAVGGVVNLVSRRATEDRPSVSIGGTAGSFGLGGTVARVGIRPTPSTGVSLRGSSLTSAGSYPFRDPATGIAHVREGSDYRKKSVGITAGLDGAESGRVDLDASYVTLDQGAPGPWSSTGARTGARRKDARFIAGLWYTTPGEIPAVSAGAMIDAQYERYTDPGIADNYYRTTSAGLDVQFRRTVFPGFLFQAGADGRFERAAGNAIDSTRERTGGAVTAAGAWTTSPLDKMTLTLTPSLRLDGSSGFRPRVSPRIGLNLDREADGGNISIHGAVASASRNPTMNELWYRGEGGEGNPALSGEEGFSVETGIRTSLSGMLSLGATWYGIWMRDRIVWVPTANPWIWSPSNIGRSRSTGWELAARWSTTDGRLVLDADYSILNSRRGEVTDEGTIRYVNQLTYVPLDKGSAGLALVLGRANGRLSVLGIGLRFVYTGARYTTDDNRGTLPSYLIANADLTLRLEVPGGSAVLRYDAGNIGNAAYQVMPGYPMPGFNHSFSILWNIEH